MRNLINLGMAIFLMVFVGCSEDNATNSNDTFKGETVTIGTQVWMTKNLDVDRYRNGDPIPQVKDSATWANLKTGAWCYYDNDPKNGEIYGKLYNWYAVNDPRGLAPDGWHVASDGEWKTLEIYLGMTPNEADNLWWRGTNEGSKLSGRADLWRDGELEQNQSFGSIGFLGLPGGFRYIDGNIMDIGYTAIWWSSTEISETDAWNRKINYENASIDRYHGIYKGCGFSVRCVKDYN